MCDHSDFLLVILWASSIGTAGENAQSLAFQKAKRRPSDILPRKLIMCWVRKIWLLICKTASRKLNLLNSSQILEIMHLGITWTLLLWQEKKILMVPTAINRQVQKYFRDDLDILSYKWLVSWFSGWSASPIWLKYTVLPAFNWVTFSVSTSIDGISYSVCS